MRLSNNRFESARKQAKEPVNFGGDQRMSQIINGASYANNV